MELFIWRIKTALFQNSSEQHDEEEIVVSYIKSVQFCLFSLFSFIAKQFLREVDSLRI